MDEEIEEDYRVLKEWGIETARIFKTSGRDPNSFDNQQVKRMMLQYPS